MKARRLLTRSDDIWVIRGHFKRIDQSSAGDTERRSESPILSCCAGHRGIRKFAISYPSLTVTNVPCLVDVLLVLGHEKLTIDLDRLFSPRGVRVLRIPKSGGAVDLDDTYRQTAQAFHIRSYFYGEPSVPKEISGLVGRTTALETGLSPYSFQIGWETLIVLRIGEGELDILGVIGTKLIWWAYRECRAVQRITDRVIAHPLPNEAHTCRPIWSSPRGATAKYCVGYRCYTSGRPVEDGQARGEGESEGERGEEGGGQDGRGRRRGEGGGWRGGRGGR